MQATATASATNGVRPTVCVLGDPAIDGVVADMATLNGWGRRTFPSTEAFVHAPGGLARPACVVVDQHVLEAEANKSFAVGGSNGDALPLVVIADSPGGAAVRLLGSCGVEVINRPLHGEQLSEAIRRALESDTARVKVRQKFERLDQAVSSLTARERSILESIVAGELNRSIAESLGVSVRTVEGDRARIVEKFNASTTSEVVGAFAEHRLLRQLGYQATNA